MSTTMVMTDLDRTLIYSNSAMDVRVPDADAPTLVTAEFHEGRPLSFLTLVAAQLIWRLPDDVLVPVTTRTVKQYRRISLPRPPGRYAVTSNGGTILIDGRPDIRWSAQVRRDIAAAADGAEILGRLMPLTEQGWVRSVRSADELFYYLVCERADGYPDGFIDELAEWCAAREWRISVQGRKVYTLPVHLKKSAAVQRVRELTGTSRLLAAGDGALDADVLEMADAAIRPRHGELWEQGWQHPGVTVTDSSGILAGEEMVRWYAAEFGVS